MARPKRPRPLFTAAKARSIASDLAITLDAGGAGNVGRGGGDRPGGEQQGATALNLDPSKLCYAPLYYSDEEMSMTEFINAAPFYSLLQDFAPPSMAELLRDSSPEEEMDVVQGWVPARPCSDYLQNLAPQSTAELFSDSSLEEEMDVVQGWFAASPSSDDLQSVEIENYITLQVQIENVGQQ